MIPEPLVCEIDRLVGKRGRSEFLTQAAEKELRRLQQIKALEGAARAWKDKDHNGASWRGSSMGPGAAQESERRLQKITSR